MSRAVLSIGSNLGDRMATLTAAVASFGPWVVAVSPVYETAPWGPVPQGDYLNAILLVEDAAAAAASWLERGFEAERAAGRTRDIRFGPRTLDVDVIAVDDVASSDPALTLPHPRAAGRAFVLVPWLALDPQAELAGIGAVADLVAALPPPEVAGVRLRPDLILAPAGSRRGDS